MSVYYQPERQSWQYEFQRGGHRYAQRGFQTKREAEAAERKRLEEIKNGAVAAQVYRDSLALRDVADKYYEEHGKFCKAAPDTLRDVTRLVTWFESYRGKAVKITDILDADIARMVAWRRGHKVKNTERPISNAGVNRSTTEVLKKLFVHARDAWGVQFAHWPKWKRHILPEPKERVRVLYAQEAESLTAEMRDDYAPLFAFALASGLRFSEIVTLTWNNVKFRERSIVLTGKGGREINRPLTERMREIVWPLRGHHKEAVFTYVARPRGPARVSAERAHRRADFAPQAAKAGQIVGERYPMTKAGAKTAWRRLRARAGVNGFRFHDFRHDYATNLLRTTGNLKLVQRQLGHADIATTARYAHVLDEEARTALDAADQARKISLESPAQSPARAVVLGGKSVK